MGRLKWRLPGLCSKKRTRFFNALPGVLQSRTTRAHLALFSVNLIYGMNYTLAKGVMPDHIAPFPFVLLRVLGALALFWIAGFFQPRESVAGQDLLRIAFCALFGVAMNQLFFFAGLNITTPINASIIMTSNPILVLIIASLLIGERITWRKVTGIGLGLAGALTLILAEQQAGFGESTMLGDLFVLINASAFAVFLVAVKPVMGKYRPLTVIKWAFLFGAIFVLPFGLPQLPDVDWSAFTPGVWGSLLFVIVCTTFLAYLLNSFALDILNSSTVSSYIYLQPVLGSVFAILMGEDELDALKVGTACTIFLGVYLVSHAPRNK